MSNVVELATGLVHACARHDDGAVSCWGDNSQQQLGVADGNAGNRNMPIKLGTIESVAELAAGTRHTCARRTDGSLWCWGRNNLGQIGDGTTTNRDRPTRVMTRTNDMKQVAAGDTHTCGLIGDGGLACWGGIRTLALAPGLLPAQTLPAAIDGVPPASQLVTGDTHTCVIAGTELWCFGLSDVGQSGERVAGRSVAPNKMIGMEGATDLDAGSTHTCAVVEGAARCWGGGAFGQLGVPRIDAGASVKMSPAGAWKQIAAGQRHTCALSDGGEVYCWGRAGEGQLGDGAPLQWNAPQAVGELPDLTALAAGSEHTCALTSAGGVFCWGRGDLGQLASNDVAGSGTPVAVTLPGPVAQISAGSEFTCARLVDGTVACWGRNNRGQIGDGTNGDRRRAVLTMLPEKVVHIATGADHACAATATGAVYCWGEAAGGRTGNGMMAAMAQNRPLLVPMVSDIVQVGAGNAHTCALGRNGQVILLGHVQLRPGRRAAWKHAGAADAAGGVDRRDRAGAGRRSRLRRHRRGGGLVLGAGRFGTAGVRHHHGPGPAGGHPEVRTGLGGVGCRQPHLRGGWWRRLLLGRGPLRPAGRGQQHRHQQADRDHEAGGRGGGDRGRRPA